MKKNILLLTLAVLLSTVSGFAESDRYRWGYKAMERGNFPNAVEHFKIGADAGYDDCYGALSIMYAMGLGTTQNLELAYKYLEKWTNNGYVWAFFYYGSRLGDWPNGFGSIPKFNEWLNDGGYTCKSFGKQPDWGKALEIDADLNFLKDELSTNPDYCKYVIEHGNEKQKRKAFEYNKNVIGHYENIDSINLTKTTKDTDKLSIYIANAYTDKWRDLGKIEFIKLYSQLFVDENGLINPFVSDSIQSIIKGMYFESNRKEARNVILTPFFSVVEKKDWDNASAIAQHISEKYNNNLPKDAIAFKERYDALINMLQQGVAQPEAFSADDVTTFHDAFNRLMEDEDRYEKDRMLMAKSGFVRSEDLLNEIKAEMLAKYNEVLLAKSATWNASTPIQEMNSWINSTESRKTQKQMTERYYEVALAKAETWTTETTEDEMNQVMEMKLTDSYKAKVNEAYQQNLWARIEPLKNSKNHADVIEKTTQISKMKYIDDSAKAVALQLNERAKDKSVSFFHLGVEGGLGLQDKDMEYGGGANIVLGRPSNWFNLYAGALYTLHNGCKAEPTLEDIYAVEKDGKTISYDDFGLSHTRLEIPVELRFNIARDSYACMYIGVGASYNMMLSSKLEAFKQDEHTDDNIVTVAEIDEAMNESYLAARLSLGVRIAGLDLSVYATKNISSPFNPEGTADIYRLSEIPGHAQSILNSPITMGAKVGIYF